MKAQKENKQQLKNMAWAVVGVLIGVNCIGTYSIKAENENLRCEISYMRQEVRDLRSHISGRLSEQSDEIEEMLMKEQSLS